MFFEVYVITQIINTTVCTRILFKKTYISECDVCMTKIASKLGIDLSSTVYVTKFMNRKKLDPS